ncbi:ABC transporter ATP-binding protein [Methylocystis sp. ATCC 49242]|uniref:ABC transporter ATP-binding protein n=1 Tax=Methylocystis sp. ATCC 49242 TaxID=622637 RepID=UPI0001F8687D|nr:ABC transporter ATP-binding protein [Methylocystis sp. ATCC 49242]
MQGHSLIELQRVTHRYGHGPTPALSDVSLCVPAAQRVAIIGRSGCGKSTLLQILAGLTKPTSGHILFGESRDNDRRVRRTLMFQRPLLFPWLTVAENIALALRFDGRGKESAKRVEELLAQVGMSGRGGSNVRELSGGQQQRAALARSLAVDPDVLLLDEPFSALDPSTRAQLRSELLALQKRTAITLVLVTHDVDDALDLAERVIVMASEPGRIIGEIELPADMTKEMRAELRRRLLDSLEPEPASLPLSA